MIAATFITLTQYTVTFGQPKAKQRGGNEPQVDTSGTAVYLHFCINLIYLGLSMLMFIQFYFFIRNPTLRQYSTSYLIQTHHEYSTLHHVTSYNGKKKLPMNRQKAQTEPDSC